MPRRGGDKIVSDQGLATIPSAFSVRETIDRLEQIVASRGLIVFARIDHARGAAEAGMALRPTELLIFGHPRGGTPLMQDQQTAGIDLPVKALAWEDAEGRVWITYNEAAWLAQRHHLGAHSHTAVEAIGAGMDAVLQAAASSSPEATRQ
jgi:uncharacterized protein (DUF302 family)